MKTDKLKEECAVFGVSLKKGNAAGVTYNGLLSLQHRGQEGAGIAVLSGNAITVKKNTGLLSEVFSHSVLENMPVSLTAVGHTRYSTTGDDTPENVQPFVTEYLTGRIATAHNGNIVNAAEIRETLKKRGLRFRATSDSEIISSLIAFYCMKNDSLLTGVREAANEIIGSFSLVILSGDNKLIAVRDGSGFRPLCIGESADGIAVASESCALDGCGFKFARDVRPGEIVIIKDGKITYEKVEIPPRVENGGLCIFEYVYFARPDSRIDGLSVYKARFNMGRILAAEHPAEADLVCGVPESGLDAAAGYAARSGIPLSTAFVKNRYIGRSFIFPAQNKRENAVRMKLNPLRANVEGQRIVLVEDSIVRGTTAPLIIRTLRDAGAKEVHMRVSSPPFRYTCHYGTDIDDEEHLLAHKADVSEICRKIGADTLGYISMDGLKKACAACSVSFCSKCFSGYGASERGHKKRGLEKRE